MPEPVLVKQGKVRNVYDAGDGKLILESSDRLSAFDIVLADTIPQKGHILNEISAYHLQMVQRSGVATHYAGGVDERSMLAYRLEMIPVEVIVRGYLYGSAWERYKAGQFASPHGTEPRKGAKFPRAVVEFTTKLEASDRPVTIGEIMRNGWMTDDELEYITEAAECVHHAVSENARRGMLIVADQKFEFGRNPALGSMPVLGDEVGTPDSSRFWDAMLYAENYETGQDQQSFDKQYVRDFLLRERGWDKKRPPAGARLTEPLLTPEVVEATAGKYRDAWKRIIIPAARGHTHDHVGATPF